MTDLETAVSCVCSGVIGFAVGYLLGTRQSHDSFAESDVSRAWPSEPLHRQEPRPAPTIQAPVRSAPPPPRPQQGSRPGAPAPVHQAQVPVASQGAEHPPVPPQRPNEERTVIRKLRAATESFRQSVDRLDAIKDHVPEGTLLRLFRNKGKKS